MSLSYIRPGGVIMACKCVYLNKECDGCMQCLTSHEEKHTYQAEFALQRQDKSWTTSINNDRFYSKQEAETFYEYQIKKNKKEFMEFLKDSCGLTENFRDVELIKILT